jgi:antitoxin MazE
MRVQIQKWGNSLALRIPKPFAEEAAVREGTVVDLSLTEGKLIAVPATKGRVTLKRLLSQVTKDNLHKEVDFGSAAGREAW